MAGPASLELVVAAVTPETEQRYFVEFWPIGNQFRAGHRLRLHIVGASGFHETIPVGANLVRVGGADGGSVLRVPVLPGSDLVGALVGSDPTPAGTDSTGAAAADTAADPGSPTPRERLAATGGTSTASLALATALVGFAALAALRGLDRRRSDGQRGRLPR